MSDLCMYEFEDNMWDGFDEGKDYKVPDSYDEYGSRFVDVRDSLKKPRNEAISLVDSVDHVTIFSTQKKDTGFTCMADQYTSFETSGLWSQETDSAISDYGKDSRMFGCNSVSHPDTAGDVTEASNHALNDESTAVDNNNMSSFLDNGCEDEESHGIYCSWPDLENFEDVERMFRNCNSPFGFGSLNNEDNLCWFPPQSAEECQKASGLQLSSINDHRETSRPDNAGPSTVNSNTNDIPTSVFPSKDIPDAGLKCFSSINMPVMKHLTKDHWIQNEQLQKVYAGSDSPSMLQLQEHMPSSDSGYGPPDRVSFNPNSDIISDESSYISSQAQSIRQSRGKMHQHQHSHASFDGNTKQRSSSSMISFSPAATLQPTGGQGHITGVSSDIPVKFELSNPLENSVTNSVSVEVSQEAMSFHQLQQVMEQLDDSTKLCIRDGLYRLARSSERRNDCGSTGDDIYAGQALVTEDTDRSAAYMDVETDTNPIDRSIAHLLFTGPQTSI